MSLLANGWDCGRNKGGAVGFDDVVHELGGLIGV